MDRPVEVWVVLGVAAFVGVLATVALAREVPGFFDPCMTWGMGGGSGGSASASLSPGGPCPSRSGTSETRAGAALRLALTDGVALLAAGLALWGAVQSRPRPLLAAALLMAGEAVVLFLGISVLFIVPLAATAVFLLAWHRLRATRPAQPLARSKPAGLVRWFALAVCAASVLMVAWLAASGCAEQAQEGVPPGAPQAQPHCAGGVTWSLAFFVLPVLVAAAGLAARRPALAWAGAGVFAAIALLFSFTMGVLLPLAAALLAGVALWHGLGCRAAAVGPAS